MTLPWIRWTLLEVTQIERGPSKKPVLLACSPLIPAGECINPVAVNHAVILWWYCNPASSTFQHELKTINSLGVFQAFSDRLGLLRQPALWIEKWPCFWPPQQMAVGQLCPYCTTNPINPLLLCICACICVSIYVCVCVCIHIPSVLFL